MNRIVLLSLVVLSPIGTIGTIGLLAPVGTGSSIGLLSVVGSKVSRAESRTTKEFDWIDFSGLKNVCLYRGTASSPDVDPDENLLDLVETVVENRTLKIRFARNISPTVEPEVVAVPTANSTMNIPSSGKAGFGQPATKCMRFSIPRSESAFTAYTTINVRNGNGMSYPRQPRVSKIVAGSVAVNGFATTAVDAINADPESMIEDVSDESGSDDEDDDH